MRKKIIKYMALSFVVCMFIGNFSMITTSAAKVPFSERSVKMLTFSPVGALSWKKVPGAQGYKLYARNPKEKNYKLIKHIRGGNKTFYGSEKLFNSKKEFCIRAYRKVNGKIVYSKWSKKNTRLDIAVQRMN